jgi:hypothetical protein
MREPPRTLSLGGFRTSSGCQPPRLGTFTFPPNISPLPTPPLTMPIYRHPALSLLSCLPNPSLSALSSKPMILRIQFPDSRAACLSTPFTFLFSFRNIRKERQTEIPCEISDFSAHRSRSVHRSATYSLPLLSSPFLSLPRSPPGATEKAST